MLSAFANSLRIPELRKRIVLTLGLLVICRVVSSLPLPFLDLTALRAAIDNIENQLDSSGGFLGWIDLFSGGALSNCAIGSLGIMPYISASIILQLMTAIIPGLERLAREGDVGRQKLTQYTKYLTIVICIVQGFVLARALEAGYFGARNQDIVLRGGVGLKIAFRFMTVVCCTTGTMVLMWLGDQITERGIGNGISLVITVGIVSRLPSAFYSAYALAKTGTGSMNIFRLVIMVALLFVVTGLTIMLTQGQRKIPIHTTKRVIGRKVYGGQNTYMPLRVNYSGVMPIIFSSAILVFPMYILRKAPADWYNFHRLAESFNYGEPLYLLFDGLMILFFSYFWVATQFNPMQIADDLKRNGGYVPGIRPGRPTAEFLDRTMSRITLMGALFLTGIAILPSVLNRQFAIPPMISAFFGGTSMLIIVGVTLDTMKQIESHLLMRHYDGFLKKGKLRGRY